MSVVIDSSAVLALLNGEPGSERVKSYLPGASISALNVAETLGRLQAAGLSEAESQAALGALGLEIIDFDYTAACATARLLALTKSLGLSIGDRACLATAQRLKRAVVSADRQWLKLKLGIKVHSIR